tara:strand:- start:2456 stop:3859 length:1404 start_codon:yes stop_codon:yes gene_type:complete
MTATQKRRPAYRVVVNYLEQVIQSRGAHNDEPLPSVRALCAQFNRSPPTIVRAYTDLEARELIYAKPRRGYFVSSKACRVLIEPGRNLLETVYTNARKPGVVPLSIDAPHYFSPLRHHASDLNRTPADIPHETLRGPSFAGSPPLRAAIAEIVLGRHYGYDDLFIVSSFQNALAAAIRSRCRGRKVLVETPCTWAIPRVLDMLGLEAVEFDMRDDPDTLVARLAEACGQGDIALALVSSRMNQITGHLLDESTRRAIATLFAQNQIHVVENASYADLCFVDTPRFHALCGADNVTVVGGFSKTIGPELGAAYIATREPPAELFTYIQFLPNKLSSDAQELLAGVLRSGEYDHAIGELNERLMAHRDRMLAALARCLPAFQCAYDSPAGGAVIWVRMPETIRADTLLRDVLAHCITIAPGNLFSVYGRFAHCLRLSYATDWSLPVEQAIRTIGHCLDRRLHAASTRAG